jgi:hypothetical protein
MWTHCLVIRDLIHPKKKKKKRKKEKGKRIGRKVVGDSREIEQGRPRKNLWKLKTLC